MGSVLWVPELLLDLFKLVGTDAAQRALVILGQLVAFIDVTTDGAFKLFHNLYSPSVVLYLFANGSYPWPKYNTGMRICQQENENYLHLIFGN